MGKNALVRAGAEISRSLSGVAGTGVAVKAAGAGGGHSGLEVSALRGARLQRTLVYHLWLDANGQKTMHLEPAGLAGAASSFW
jgi:hypothetical protein